MGTLGHKRKVTRCPTIRKRSRKHPGGTYDQKMTVIAIPNPNRVYEIAWQRSQPWLRSVTH